MGESGPCSLDALVERYTKERIESGAVKRQSALDQRRFLRQFAASFGRREVAKLGEADVIRWLGSIGHQLPSTRRNKLSVVRGFCRWLVRKGHVRRDPMAEIRPVRQPRTVPKVIDHDDLADMLDLGDERDRLMILLMVQCGLRVGEVAALELGDLDRQRVTVRQGKGGHQRFVPLVAEVREALDVYLTVRGGAAGPLLHHRQHPGSGVQSRTLSARFRRLAREAGVKRFAGDGVSAHGCRRTCATDMADNGAPLEAVAEVLGHARLDTTRQFYRRVQSDRLAPLVEGRRYGAAKVVRLSDAG